MHKLIITCTNNRNYYQCLCHIKRVNLLIEGFEKPNCHRESRTVGTAQRSFPPVPRTQERPDGVQPRSRLNKISYLLIHE